MTVTRGPVTIPSVAFQKDPARPIGFIQVAQFGSGTPRELREAVTSLTAKGAKGLVLDLRGNPGGLLEQAIQVSDLFLSQGTIVTTVSLSERQREEKRAHADDGDNKYPLAVLVNPGSASASEIVAGALLIAGLLTRPAALLLIADIAVAIVTTKIPLLLGTTRLPLPPVAPQIGLWALLHESRSDYAQLMFTAFLLLAGPGAWALDAFLARRRGRPQAPATVAGRPLPAPPRASAHAGRPVRLIGG